MPPGKIKVVDVLDEACDDNVLPEAIEDIDPSDKQTPGVGPNAEQTPQQPSPQGLGHEEEVAQVLRNVPQQVTQVTQPVSNTNTAELVECPDCKKKMTTKTLKYSHAKNCTAKFSAPRVLPAVKEAEEPETEEEEEEEEEVKPSPPMLKRTVSVAYPSQPTVQKVSKQPPPVKKTVSKVKQPPTRYP